MWTRINSVLNQFREDQRDNQQYFYTNLLSVLTLTLNVSICTPGLLLDAVQTSGDDLNGFIWLEFHSKSLTLYDFPRQHAKRCSQLCAD